MNVCNTPQEAEDLTSSITSTIAAAMKKASSPRRTSTRQPQKLPRRIRDIIAAKNRARRRHQHTGSFQDRAEFNRLQRLVKLELSDYSNDEWERRLCTLDTEDQSLWRMSKALLRVPSQNKPLTHGARTAQSAREKAELMADFLESTFQPAETNNLDHIHQVHTSVQNFLSQPLQRDVAEPTTTEEVKQILSSYPPYKAAGHDNIPYAALQALPRTWLELIVHLFNSLLRLAYFPSCWKHAKIITLPKPGKDTTSPSGYRPISLLPTMSKLFEKVVQKRLQNTLDAHQVLRPEQFGFRSRHSTIHQLLRLVDEIITAFNNRHFVASLFLDITRAFDSVWHEGLLHRLISYNFPPYLIHLINSYLQHRSFTVTNDDINSATHPICAGVPQGSVLGPLLFLTYINTLPSLRGCSLYLFADDTAITSTSMRHQMAVQRVQHYADLLTTWFNTWRLKVNATKSQAVTFTRRRVLDNVPDLRVADGTVPWTSKAHYLGVTLDSKLTWKNHVDELASRVNRRMAMLYPLYKRRSPMSVSNKVLIYKQVLRPAITYACQIWGTAAKTHLKKLHTLQNRYLRTAVDADWYIPNADIHRDLKFPPLTDFILNISRKFYSSLPDSYNALIRGLGEYDLDPGERYKRPRLVLGQQ